MGLDLGVEPALLRAAHAHHRATVVKILTGDAIARTREV